MDQKPSPGRTIAYIDGFNLYYGLKGRGWKQFYWIDPAELARQLLSGGRELVNTKYFTAKIKQPEDKRKRQAAFLDAVSATTDAEIVYGKFARRDRKCDHCSRKTTRHEEKMTDSAIAAHLVADALRDEFDTAMLIGGDTDILPAIKMVRRHCPEKRLEAWFPPLRINQHLGQSCHDTGNINGNHLGAAVMPDTIVTPDGINIVRPDRWAGAPPTAASGA
ncbi:MAG: hypothetical protein DHS20C14_17200 [Phycisphaeraceae bacterium]|nr:MAG: hypothetical protein DHS20C14_17200 [Phycisphaeraceae bacterium]